MQKLPRNSALSQKTEQVWGHDFSPLCFLFIGFEYCMKSAKMARLGIRFLKTITDSKSLLITEFWCY